MFDAAPTCVAMWTWASARGCLPVGMPVVVWIGVEPGVNPAGGGSGSGGVKPGNGAAEPPPTCLEAAPPAAS